MPHTIDMPLIAKTPEPPYYAVIFISLHTQNDIGYTEMSEKMMALASQQQGFLGVETARENMGITVSYWTDLESVRCWKANLEHRVAQKLGRENWYSSFKIRIAKVEHDYGNEHAL